MGAIPYYMIMGLIIGPVLCRKPGGSGDESSTSEDGSADSERSSCIQLFDRRFSADTGLYTLAIGSEASMSTKIMDFAKFAMQARSLIFLLVISAVTTSTGKDNQR